MSKDFLILGRKSAITLNCTYYIRKFKALFRHLVFVRNEVCRFYLILIFLQHTVTDTVKYTRRPIDGSLQKVLRVLYQKELRCDRFLLSLPISVMSVTIVIPLDSTFLKPPVDIQNLLYYELPFQDWDQISAYSENSTTHPQHVFEFRRNSTTNKKHCQQLRYV